MLDPPIGDPAAIRSVGAKLAHIGEQVASAATGMRNRISTMTFEGPAGDRFRERLQNDRSGATAIAGALKSLSMTLVSGAAQVEADLAAYRAYVQRLEQASRDAR